MAKEEQHIASKSFVQAFKAKMVRVWQKSGNEKYAVLAVLLLVAIGIPAYAFLQSGPTEYVITPQPGEFDADLEPESPSPPIITKELPLDGTEVEEDVYNEIMQFLPMAVMIENSVGVRPVSGLSRADLVYEALVEGGITRYMAIFHRHDADEIMPVRSSRSYYLDWLAGLDATYMHIGGAISDNPRAVALPRIFNEGTLSYMNVYGSWWRRNDRFAPHNAFTSTTRMKDAQEKLGWARVTTLEAWAYKDDDGPAETANTTAISLSYGVSGSSSYSVDWAYNAEKNYYNYSVGGVAQTDPTTNEEVTAKNVIIVLTGLTAANDGYGHVLYDTIGSGRALIFIDGTVVDGTWEKPDLETRETFFDGEHREMQLNRGRTWIHFAPDNSVISY